jgi:hypothetical protein
MTALSFVSKDNEGNQNLFFGFGQGFGMGRRNFYRIPVTSALSLGCDAERHEQHSYAGA